MCIQGSGTLFVGISNFTNVYGYWIDWGDNLIPLVILEYQDYHFKF
jgi:hypothetical protein